MINLVCSIGGVIVRYFAVILYLFIILLLLAERWYNDRALSSFRFVIHVNGIRGKTDVCRRLDAALRANGFRVFTKTTGTHPCYLDTQGREHQLTRLGRANIREQMLPESCRFVRIVRLLPSYTSESLPPKNHAR